MPGYVTLIIGVLLFLALIVAVMSMDPAWRSGGRMMMLITVGSIANHRSFMLPPFSRTAMATAYPGVSSSSCFASTAMSNMMPSEVGALATPNAVSKTRELFALTIVGLLSKSNHFVGDDFLWTLCFMIVWGK